MSFIADLAAELNTRAVGRPIGQLQELRRKIHGKDRAPTNQLFDSRTIFEDYAFNVGGRTELQFNIGLESIDSREFLRHGVAFSLQLNRNLPDIAPLVPKIAKFNEFIRDYAEELSDFRMWYYQNEHRSSNYPPTPLPSEIVIAGVFIFIGKLQPSAHPDIAQILDDFDRLLSLYRFVEGNESYPINWETVGGFRFSPGCTIKPSVTKASIVGRQLDIILRHNDLQTALHLYLAGRYGDVAVGTEQGAGTGSRGRIDVVVRTDSRYWFYEIKIGSSARACIREALAQLLEYSFWPGAQEAERLIVVGEPPLDEEAAAFLSVLRKRFRLPIYYQQFIMDTATLVSES